MKLNNYLKALLTILTLIFIFSAIHPKDILNWLLEIFPALSGLAILASSYKKFSFTKLTYTLVFIHCSLLFIGGHYSFAEVPLFNWMNVAADYSMNNFNIIVHLSQGLLAAVLAREILLRKSIISKRGWASFVSVGIAMMANSILVLLNWILTLLTLTNTNSFHSFHGYIWNTQFEILYNRD